MFSKKITIFIKRNLKYLIIKLFYKFKLDLLYFQKKDRFELVLENSQYSPISKNEDIVNAIKTIIPVGCNKELIRVGGDGDGAYLLPNDIYQIDACFSPGTSSHKFFEDDLANIYNVKSFLSDASVNESELDLIENMQFFQKKWIGDFNSKDTLTIEQWIKNCGHKNSNNLLLQMDIEGCEYSSIISIPEEQLKKFKIIVIEFHDLDRLIKARFLNHIFMPVMNKILEYFDCVHAHGNNNCGIVEMAEIKVPKVIELSFYRKDLNIGKKEKLIPHPLDILNVSSLPPLILDNIWRN